MNLKEITILRRKIRGVERMQKVAGTRQQVTSNSYCQTLAIREVNGSLSR